MVTASEPDTAVDDVQSAEQEVALLEDQVRVDVLSKTTEVGSADKLTVGAGVVGVIGGVPPPPPPPPPQEAIKNKEDMEIPELDVFQEGYIYAQLEKANDFVIMPMVEKFYTNTREINEYLQYYPEYHKRVNPNLPIFKGKPNPFHLANLRK